MDGVIKTVNLEKRFGFIRGTDTTDRFFHESQLMNGVLIDKLTRGMVVQFEHEDGERGPRAVHVQVMSQHG